MAEAKDGRKWEFGRLALVYNAQPRCAQVRAEIREGHQEWQGAGREKWPLSLEILMEGACS
jgi:hypothetical protein